MLETQHDTNGPCRIVLSSQRRSLRRAQPPETIPTVATAVLPESPARTIATVRPGSEPQGCARARPENELLRAKRSRRLRTGSFSEASGVGPRTRTAHRVSLLVLAGAVAFAAAFTLSRSSLDSTPLRAVERTPRHVLERSFRVVTFRELGSERAAQRRAPFGRRVARGRRTGRELRRPTAFEAA